MKRKTDKAAVERLLRESRKKLNNSFHFLFRVNISNSQISNFQKQIPKRIT